MLNLIYQTIAAEGRQQATREEKQKIKQIRQHKKKALEQEIAQARREKGTRIGGEDRKDSKQKSEQNRRYKKQVIKPRIAPMRTKKAKMSPNIGDIIADQTKEEEQYQEGLKEFKKTCKYDLYDKKFYTMNDAAIDFGNVVLNDNNVLPKLDYEGKDILSEQYEYGCRIYKYKDKFYLTIPYHSSSNQSVSHDQPDQYLVAYAHTHAYSYINHLEKNIFGTDPQKKRQKAINTYQNFSGLLDQDFGCAFKSGKLLYLSYKDKETNKIVTKRLSVLMSQEELDDFNKQHPDAQMFWFEVKTDIKIVAQLDCIF